ncbi:hypothetical protein EBZ39_19030 [bacterium]|nr:hypothetical protein [bacterium]
MATFEQLPGSLDLTFVAGDQVDVGVTFTGTNLTGYTFSSYVYVSRQTVPLDGGDTVVLAGSTVAAVAITQVSLANGQLSLGLTEAQTADLSAAGSYRWYLRWVAPGSITRTVLSGNVVVATP